MQRAIAAQLLEFTTSYNTWHRSLFDCTVGNKVQKAVPLGAVHEQLLFEEYTCTLQQLEQYWTAGSIVTGQYEPQQLWQTKGEFSSCPKYKLLSPQHTLKQHLKLFVERQDSKQPEQVIPLTGEDFTEPEAATATPSANKKRKVNVPFVLSLAWPVLCALS